MYYDDLLVGQYGITKVVEWGKDGTGIWGRGHIKIGMLIPTPQFLIKLKALPGFAYDLNV